MGLKFRLRYREADYCITQRRALYVMRRTEAIDFSILIPTIRTTRTKERHMPAPLSLILFGFIAILAA
ncbi:MAG: hypothetical protein KKG92_08275, partial [Gammaproteobacteria bacterium]|nr:hypothetical protein [Gammaproteobacteria bacterium]